MNGRTAWRGGAAALAVTGAVMGAIGGLVACGSSDVTIGDDGGVEAGVDSTVPSDSPASPDVVGNDGPSGDGAGLDGTGGDGGTRDASPRDAAIDGAWDAAFDARPAYCVGTPGSLGSVTCPPSGATAPCDAGGACGSIGSATFTACTATDCTGSASGIGESVVCYAGSTCTIAMGGIDFCAACGVGATCSFTDNGSAGSQAYACAPGSDCTIAINGASGDRLVNCALAKKCTVTGFVSGSSTVFCPADCSVSITGGFSQVCCDTPPVQCADGHYVCPPAGDGGDAGADGGPDAC